MNRPRLPARALVVRTMYLSVDPYMRCRFNDETGADYVSPFALEEPLTSAGIGEIVAVGGGLVGEYSVGDVIVEGSFHWPWTELGVLDLGKAEDAGSPMVSVVVVCMCVYVGVYVAGRKKEREVCGV